MTSPPPDIKTRLNALSNSQLKLLALRLGIATSQLPDSESQKILAAFVTLDDEASDSELQAYLRERLPQYMVPGQITRLPTMPRTPNGKIDRQALADYQPDAAPATATQQTVDDTLNPIEKQILDIWQTLLDRDTIHKDDNFFDVGGYSLLAIRMLGQLQTVFDKELPPSIIMESPTIAQLAERLQDDDDIGTQTVFTLQPEGTQPPLYCFQVHKYGVITYRYIAQYLGTARPVYGVALPQNTDNTPDTIDDLARIFVENLLRHQPEPPYYLSGMSIAGLIAYEVARQLWQQGIQDVQVLLFDTYGPGYPRRLSTGGAVWHKLKKHLTMLFGGSTDRAVYLRELLWRNQYRASFQIERYFKRYATTMGFMDEQTSDEAIDDLPPDDDDMLLALQKRYFSTPKPYPGDMILYRASLQPLRSAYDDTLGWDNFVTGTVHVRHIRGNHSGILRYPFVERLVASLRQELEALDRTSS